MQLGVMKVTQRNQRTDCLERSDSTLRLQKEKNSGYCVVVFVDKANVFFSNISASHIRMQEIQNFTLERRSFNFTCLSLNKVCFLLGIYMCFIYII